MSTAGVTYPAGVANFSAPSRTTTISPIGTLVRRRVPSDVAHDVDSGVLDDGLSSFHHDAAAISAIRVVSCLGSPITPMASH